MQPSTGYFRSDFIKICDFIPEMPFNSASVLIRSSKFFLRNSLSKVDMHAYWAIAYAYTVVLVSIFVPKSRILSRNAVRF